MSKEIVIKDSIIHCKGREIKGRPSMSGHADSLRKKVTELAKNDKRFKTGRRADGTNYPPGYCPDPYVCDILMPDDGDENNYQAIVSTDDGRLVKHGFTCDGDNCTLNDGDSEDTDRHSIYTRELEQYEAAIQAKASEANAAAKSAKAFEASELAHKATKAATKHGSKDRHEDAQKAHTKAAELHNSAAESSEGATQKSHRQMAKQHGEMADEHEESAEDCEIEATIIEPIGDLITCKASCEISAASKWSMDAPVNFMYMPAGVTTVSATFREGEPIRMTVKCTESTAGKVNASLAKWHEKYPKRKPFGCIEHRMEESAFNPVKFSWHKGDKDHDPGVYCEALPSELGCRNVNGRIHQAFSPSFTTDADYAKSKVDASGMRFFPDGIRGSASDPAEVTGVHFSVGSLTNMPAFRNIQAIAAREARSADDIFASLAKQASPPATNNGALNKGNTMKLLITKAHGEYKQGAEIEVEAKDAATLMADGYAVDAVQASENKKLKDRLTGIEKGKITQAIERAKTRGAIEAKDETVLTKHMGRFDSGSADADTIVELIDYLPAKQDRAALYARQTARVTDDKDTAVSGRFEYGEDTPVVSCKAWWKERQPMNGLVRQGNVKEALTISAQHSFHVKNLLRAMDKHDFSLGEVIRAGDVTDPDTQVGTLETGLVLMRNLGYLKNKLGWMSMISTDLRNEPARFAQPVFTRYITPPNVLTYVPGVGYTSDATTISNASATTSQASETVQTSGTLTKSAPSTTDVTVTMDQHKAVEIMFSTDKLGKTARNLFAEQQGSQFYSLAETVNIFFLNKLFAATWSGIVTKLSLGQFGMPGMIQLKNRMTLSKLPDVGRFALLHSFYHDGLLTDTNLLLAKAILSVINKDDAEYNTGELPTLYGVKPLESQLASYASGTALAPTIGATDGSVSFAGINQVGFAGNSASMVFVARVPQDYTTILPGIPATAAIEILTEPDSGLSIMFVKYVNHEKAAVSARCALMYGAAQGDPRQGIVLAP